MYKIFKNNFIIKIQSQKAMPLVIKSNWIANISKLKKIKSLKQNFLRYFKSIIVTPSAYWGQYANCVWFINYVLNEIYIIKKIYNIILFFINLS